MESSPLDTFGSMYKGITINDDSAAGSSGSYIMAKINAYFLIVKTRLWNSAGTGKYDAMWTTLANHRACAPRPRGITLL